MDNSHPFTQRFRYLVNTSGLKKVFLARELKTSRSTIQRWMVGDVPREVYQEAILAKVQLLAEAVAHG